MPRVRRSSGSRARGQSLAEFAIAFPVFMLIVGGIIQFGIIFWGQNTLNQIVRDTGRWAATQQTTPTCNAITNLATTADQIALNSSFIGYAAGQWTASGHYVAYADNTSLPVAAPSTTGLEAVWSQRDPAPPPAKPCPPADNTTVWFVTIRATSHVPIFFPFVPGGGNLSSTTDFRMEPKPK